MRKILVAVDGSANAERAVKFVAKESGWDKERLEVHLLNVQTPLAGVNVKMFISHDSLNDYYRDAGMTALARPRELLDAAGIRNVHHIGVGDPAETIAEYAEAKACEHLVVGGLGKGAVAGMVLGSVATKVMRLAKVPVTLVK